MLTSENESGKEEAGLGTFKPRGLRPPGPPNHPLISQQILVNIFAQGRPTKKLCTVLKSGDQDGKFEPHFGLLLKVDLPGRSASRPRRSPRNVP